MPEKTLRCPRCEKPTPIAGGACVHCGLAVEFAHQATRRDLSERRFAVDNRLGVGVDRLEEELGRGAAARGTGAAATPGGSSPYRVPPNPDRAGGLDEARNAGAAAPQRAPRNPDVAPRDPLIQTGRYDIDGVRRDSSRAPKGGDVAPGALTGILMDPNENPHDEFWGHDPGSRPPTLDNAGAPAPLGLGPRLYGDADEPRSFGDPVQHRGPPISEDPPGNLGDATPPNPGDAAPHRAPQNHGPQSDWLIDETVKAERRHYLLTRVAPLFIAFLLVLLVGRRYVAAPIVLEGVYTASFSDGQGRKIDCRTRFTPRGEDPQAVQGVLQCKIYQSAVSTERVEEPLALKPLLGDGAILYAGRSSPEELELKLGPFDAADARSVKFLGRFADGAASIQGVATDQLGHSVQATFQKQ